MVEDTRAKIHNGQEQKHQVLQPCVRHQRFRHTACGEDYYAPGSGFR